MNKENNGRTNFYIECHLCKKSTPYYGHSYPVIFKQTKERVLVCDECIKFIQQNKLKYRIIKNGG
jgi:hypothetical protein